MKTRYWILIGILVIIIDQLFKFIIINNSTEYVQNRGGAFGVGGFYIILALSIALIIGISLFLVINRKKEKYIKYFPPLILILSASIANMIDRIFRGYVVDFIDIKVFNFPSFNIADIIIVISVFLLLFTIIKNTFNVKNN